MQTTSITYIIRLICGNIVFLSNLVMATIPIATPIPTSDSTSEDSQTNCNTDLSNINMEDEMNTDVSSWTAVEKEITTHD